MQANENPPGGKRLPFCTFPTASDTALHGFQTLPAGLTVFSVETALPYRSSKCRIVKC